MTSETKYTVLYYCESWTERWTEHRHPAIFKEIACESMDAVITALTEAEVVDADEIRVYVGEDIRYCDDNGVDRIDWDAVRTRSTEEKKRRELETKAAAAKAEAERVAKQREAVEVHERKELARLQEKYNKTREALS